MAATKKTLDALRTLTTSHGESAVIALARGHGALIVCNEVEFLIVPKCPWVVLDQEKFPRLYWGWFPSEYDAAMVYCVEHEVTP
jgi:hypothetical protein